MATIRNGCVEAQHAARGERRAAHWRVTIYGLSLPARHTVSSTIPVSSMKPEDWVPFHSVQISVSSADVFFVFDGPRR